MSSEALLYLPGKKRSRRVKVDDEPFERWVGDPAEPVTLRDGRIGYVGGAARERLLPMNRLATKLVYGAVPESASPKDLDPRRDDYIAGPLILPD